MLRAIRPLVFVGFLVMPIVAAAQSGGIEIRDAWIRGTVAGQTAAGAFMEITSQAPARLVGAASPLTGTVQIHSMKMEGGIMKMAPAASVELPARRAVRLASGGYHVMLLDLKRPLKTGERVPLKLTFELAGGKRETIELQVEVRALTGEKPHSH